ncbi:MAG: hypothetical protein EBX47_08110 [Synechococcaceae bacterium WB8_1B_057]|nr:hypothetical protein [Synechococcaceae bacterium WB6_1A_059]NDG79380.1 hypothetical protein [Synechococcaceae bacterium WB8_1B_057]
MNVILDLDAEVTGANRVMYQRNLTIQKGIKNQIRIQFKNSDQKRVRIYSTQTYIFSMYDAINQRLLVEKPLEILDVATTSTKGLALLTLTESDILNLPKSSYNYAIKLIDTDGSYLPAYSNTYYGINGVIELKEDINSVLQASTSVNSFTKIFNGATNLYEHKSGHIDAQPQYNGNSALHTLACYLSQYRGTITIRGTLENSPTSDDSYDTIVTKTYDQKSGIVYFNFNGVYSYIRVYHIPAQAPAGLDNDDPSYFGSFDKFLYRS